MITRNQEPKKSSLICTAIVNWRIYAKTIGRLYDIFVKFKDHQIQDERQKKLATFEKNEKYS